MHSSSHLCEVVEAGDNPPPGHFASRVLIRFAPSLSGRRGLDSDGGIGGRRDLHYQSSPSGIPSLRRNAFRRVFSDTFLVSTRRTDPSPSSTLVNPSIPAAVSFGSGFFGSMTRSP